MDDARAMDEEKGTSERERDRAVEDEIVGERRRVGEREEGLDPSE